MLKKILLGFVLIVLVAIVGGYFYAQNANSYQTDGELTLKGLKEPVRVVRDEKNMPYIYANNRHDLLMAQGFVMAQDRLFQMQLTRLFAEGRIAELATNEITKKLDLKYRTIGLKRWATKHAEMLNESELADLRAFTDGINQFIERGKNIHIEFQLAGIEPEKWAPENAITILYYMGWDSSANLSFELIAQQMLKKIGKEKFQTILPIQTNPDDTTMAVSTSSDLASVTSDWEAIAALDIGELWEMPKSLPLRWGSNMWVTDGSKSTSGKPILAGDPHLDARIMPGTMYSCGLFTPEIQAVGITVPGMPGLIIGRNKYMTNSLTNAYLDMQDLYVLQRDPNNPNNYLIGEESFPLQAEEEVFRFKGDGEMLEERHTILRTKYGVVVNDLFPEFMTDQLLVLRWSATENMQSSLGIWHLLNAKNIEEASSMLGNATMACNNIIMADINGKIGWRTIGTIPKRLPNTGKLPRIVTDSIDNWLGFVEADSMPHEFDIEKGWYGNANHNIMTSDYPYYVSNQFASRYRYERVKTLMEGKEKISVEDHWNYQRDKYNPLAALLAPIFAKHLMEFDQLEKMAEEMNQWDYIEHKESVATAIYQNIYRHLAQQIFIDELGEELASAYMKSSYIWQERFEKMVLEGESEWFDDVRTPEKEALKEMVIRAGELARDELTEQLGEDIAAWQWGKVHRISFVNPLARSGAGKSVLGKQFEMGGSGETLYRARYSFSEPTEVSFAACIRMVVDLADDDKVQAVLSGGITGRTFHSNQSDQLEPFMDGTPTFWWYSKEKVEENKKSALILNPQG